MTVYGTIQVIKRFVQNFFHFFKIFCVNLITQFLLTVEIIHSDLEILIKFGKLKALLGKAGNILSDADIFIAATAIVKCNMLITGNVNHFKRIEELRLENWIR